MRVTLYVMGLLRPELLLLLWLLLLLHVRVDLVDHVVWTIAGIFHQRLLLLHVGLLVHRLWSCLLGSVLGLPARIGLCWRIHLVLRVVGDHSLLIDRDMRHC